MATLNETPEWVGGVYQIETTDPVLGGAPNEATGAGLDNIPHLHLAKRTSWLKAQVDNLLNLVVDATTSVRGIVQLSASVNSTSTATAATSSAVKSANDNANSRALASRAIAAAGLATGGGDLSANRTISVPAASKAEAEAGVDNTKAMTPLRVTQQITAQVRPATSSVPGIVLISNSLADDSPTSAASANAVRRANDNANDRAHKEVTISTGGLATGGGDLTANRAISVPAATKAVAEAGTDNTTAMTPLRVAQALAAQIGGLVGAATTAVAGIVRLSASVNSTSTATAATSSAVKSANDNANSRALASRAIAAAGLATGGGDLSANRTISVPAASKAEAEAGVDNTKAMTPLRAMQLLASVSITTGGLANGGGDLSGTRHIGVPAATKEEAEAGAVNDKAMTPLRAMQLLERRAVGSGQSWTNPTRTLGTWYQNTTGRPIMVMIRSDKAHPVRLGTSTSSFVTAGIDGNDMTETDITFVVPDSGFYMVETGAEFGSATWLELR